MRSIPPWDRSHSRVQPGARQGNRRSNLVGRAGRRASVYNECQTFVALGGEIGFQPLIADAVRTRMQAIAPYPVDVRTSTLGERAPVLGALATALDVARADLSLPAISTAGRS